MSKIWGEPKRILDTPNYKVDHLTLLKDTFCSMHYHAFKYNEFKLLKGKVLIEIQNKGFYCLDKVNSSFTVPPCTIHRFIVQEDGEMLEMVYTTRDPVDEEDIRRYIQGGKVINGEYIQEKDLPK